MMEKMRKITKRMLGTDENMVIFTWIATHGEHGTWVVKDIDDSQQIKKGTLNFKCKA